MWIALMECRYFLESEESTSPLRHGCEQFFIVKVTDTHKPFSCPECGMEHLIGHQYTQTFASSEGRTLEPASTSFSAGSLDHARTSALQEMERVWEEADQGYFSKSFASLANFDPDSFSWKTSQLSLFGGLTAFSWSSLRWGTTVAGRLYQPQRWEPRTLENDGSYLPTPLAQDCGTQNNQKNGIPTLSLGSMARKGRWPTPRASEAARGHGGLGGDRKESQYTLSQTIGGQLNPTWVEWLMGYRTEWTALESWVMQWFRSKRASHSKDLSASTNQERK